MDNNDIIAKCIELVIVFVFCLVIVSIISFINSSPPTFFD